MITLKLSFNTRTLFICVLSVLTGHLSVAQLPTFHWLKTFDKLTWHADNANGRTVGVDAAGNVYSAGRFEYTIDLDPGPAVYPVTATGQFNTGFYISKLDANGNFMWGKQISALLEFSQLEMKVDAAGNSYIVTDSRTAADLDPGAGDHSITLTGFRDVIIVKLNTNGEFVWGKQVGGPGDTGPTASSIELDRDNNVLISGQFNNTVDFDPGPATYNLTSSAHFQAFVMKLSNDGNFMWAKQFGNGPIVYSGSNVYDMKCDAAGNIFLTGRFYITCDFDPGPGVYNVTSSVSSVADGFVCKLDADLNFIWVKTFGQAQNPVYNGLIDPLGIDVDRQGNAVITGYFIGNFDLDPGPGSIIHQSIRYDCFLVKLQPNGDLAWAHVINGDEYDNGHDIAVDLQDNIYLMGSFSPTVDLNPGPGTHIVTTPNYGAHALIKFQPNGNFVYAGAFPDLQSHSGGGIFRRMVLDPALNIYITGIGGNIDYDPGPQTQASPVGGGPFVLKLGACLNPTASTLNITACSSYTANGETYTANGTYVQTIPNGTGCDSVITLHLTLNATTTNLAKTICAGESFYAGGSMQTTGGTYYDTLQTSHGCDSVIITRLTVQPKPSPNLGPDRSICRNEAAILNPGNFTTYTWQDNSHGSTLTVANPGTYWVRVADTFNCMATDTLRVISMLEPPAGFLRHTDSVCNNRSLLIAPLQSFSSYLWSGGESGKTISVNAPGIYRLTVTDHNGCKGRDSIFVYPKQCLYGLYVPSAFTPNNDGKNDVFRPMLYGDLEEFRMQVYNRWGRLVFESADVNKGWDATLKGMPQENGAYIWVCQYRLSGQPSTVEKGTVLLLR